MHLFTLENAAHDDHSVADSHTLAVLLDGRDGIQAVLRQLVADLLMAESSRCGLVAGEDLLKSGDGVEPELNQVLVE